VETLLTGKNILLGVTGGIAAYKSAELLRELQRRGAVVRVIMTRNATRFVSQLTFSTLSGAPALVDSFPETAPREIEHVELARWGDLLLVAPATANIIGKAAAGICDDLLSTTICSFDGPQLFAPAMNSRMYQNAAVQRNLKLLWEQGVELVAPVSGWLACGESGTGKLADPTWIARAAGWVIAGGPNREERRCLQGCRLLINAGPTREPLDPVRFLSNRSSGRMGYALAGAALVAGAEVTLISGPTALKPPPCRVIAVQTAAEMEQAVADNFAECDAFIATAAVADWSPVPSAKKLKKEDGAPALELQPAPDILARMGERKERQLLVGFALETEAGQAAAQSKIETKQLDLICLNHPERGLEGEETQLTLLDARGGMTELEGDKEAVAWQLVQRLAEQLV